MIAKLIAEWRERARTERDPSAWFPTADDARWQFIAAHRAAVYEECAKQLEQASKS